MKPLSGVGVIRWPETSRKIAVVLQLLLCHICSVSFW